jgi:hypothetical protein
MASDVRVTLGANLEVTTTGVEQAKRQAAEVQKATQDVGASARDAGDAVADAMGNAASAAERAAEAARRAAEASTRPTPTPPTTPAPAAAPAAAPDAAPDARGRGAALAYDPSTHAYRAQNMLYGIEATLAGGVTTEAQQRQLEARAGKAGFYVDSAREGGLPDPQLEALVEHLQAVADALDENREAIKESTRGGALAAPDAGGDNASLRAMTDELRNLASGGLGTMGVFGRFLGRAGLVGLGVGAAVGAVNMATRALTSGHAEGREQIVALADLARQYDTDDNPLAYFRQASGAYRGFTDERLANIGFSATDATAFMARLDLPGGPAGMAAPMADTRSGLEFARATGIDEGNVADLLRTLGLGGIERGQSERALVLIREAMREGVKEGVSASDTFRNLEQALGGIFRGGVNLTESGIAFQAGLLTTLARTGDRQFQGAQGAANAERYQTAMLGGGDLAMQLALYQLAGPFTAEELGYTDDTPEGRRKKRTYEDLLATDPHAAMQMAFDLAPMNDLVMKRLAEAFDVLFKNKPALKSYFFRQMGFEGDALLTAVGLSAGETFTEATATGEGLPTDEEGFADVQAANTLAYTSLSLRIAESDQKLAMSLESLAKLGPIEETLRSFWLSVGGYMRQVLQRMPGDGGSLFEPGPIGPTAPAGSIKHGRLFGMTDAEAAAHDAALGGRERPPQTDPISRGLDRLFDWAAEGLSGLLGGVVQQESGGRPDAVNIVRQMAGGIEATSGDAVNMTPIAASYGGAFSWTQILASNLMGDHGQNRNTSVRGGWDKWFMDQDASADVRQQMQDAGLDVDDPIPDDIAALGAEGLAEWYRALPADQRSAIDSLVHGMSASMIEDYARISREEYGVEDEREAYMRGTAAWYTGPGHYAGSGMSVLDPAFALDPSNPFYRRKQSDGGESLEDYLDKFDFGKPAGAGPEGSLTPQRLDRLFDWAAEGLSGLLGGVVQQESGGRPDDVNERTTAFGAGQMPGNLMGDAGWDREFMGRSPHADDWHAILSRHGLDPDDPIPDHIASEGGYALQAWRAGLDSEARSAVDDFLMSLSDEKLAEYMDTAISYGADPFTAKVAAAAVWYSGNRGYLTGGSLMHPDNDAFTEGHGPEGDEPSHQQYVEGIFGPLEYNDDGTVRPAGGGPEGSLTPQRMDITVRVEGLDTITIAGVEDEHANRIESAFRGFLEAAASPTSFRGA